MKKNNLSKLRKKLDALDEKLLAILKKRVNLVNQVLKNKKYKNQIVDKKRIKIILTKCNPPIEGFDGKVSIVRILENN